MLFRSLANVVGTERPLRPLALAVDRLTTVFDLPTGAVKALDGVREVSVDLPSRTVAVAFAPKPGKLDVRSIRRAIEKAGYDVFLRSSHWMIHNALSLGRACTLIALWDGAEPDGPGGTYDIIQETKRRGVKFVHLDARQLGGTK